MITASIGLLAPSARAAEPARALLARFACEPDVATLQEAAARRATFDPDAARSWLKRARAAALLPTVNARVGRGPSSYGIDYGAEAANEWRFSVSATWHLDRLVFDRAELAIRRDAEREAGLRDKLYADVAHLYFARRRLQVQALADPPDRATPEAIERTIAIDELTALLDGLTGGALSHPKAFRWRSPSAHD